MDGWDSWAVPPPPSDRQRIGDALANARAASQRDQALRGRALWDSSGPYPWYEWEEDEEEY